MVRVGAQITNTSNFDLPGSSSIPNDITPQNQHHNAGISWDFSKLGTEPDFKGSGIFGNAGTAPKSISDFGGGDDGDFAYKPLILNDEDIAS